MATYNHSESWNTIGNADDIKKLQNYLFQNNELLRYMFANLDPEENYSKGALQKYIERDNKIALLIFDTKGLQVGIGNLKTETEAQFKATAEKISTEVKRATNAEGELSTKITQTANTIRSEVSDSTNRLQSQITQNANSISLKVSKGDVSSQISLETGTVTISGNRLVVNSTNFKLDSSGNATFSGKITGGTIDIGDVFYAAEDEIRMGDFFVSTDKTYCFQSTDGSVKITTADSPNGNQSIMEIDRATVNGILSCGTLFPGLIRGDDMSPDFYDIQLHRSWWIGTLYERVRLLSDCLWELADIIDEQWSDYTGVYDALDEFYESEKPW